MRIPLAEAAGGAIGASARYLLAGGLGLWLGAGLPVDTLAVNALGSFTTVSAFSLDVLGLLERGASGLAGLDLAASVTLPLAGIYAGMRLLRLALS